MMFSAAALLVPSVAMARTIAPPGNSGVSQYVEVVPTASGGQPTHNVHIKPTVGTGGSGGSSGGGGSAVPSSTINSLNSQGSTGQAAAALAVATAPPAAPKKYRTKGTGKPSATRHSLTSSDAPSSLADAPSATSGLFKAITGSSSGGGLGLLLPLILIGSLFGAAALVLVKRRGPV